MSAPNGHPGAASAQPTSDLDDLTAFGLLDGEHLVALDPVAPLPAPTTAPAVPEETGGGGAFVEALQQLRDGLSDQRVAADALEARTPEVQAQARQLAAQIVRRMNDAMVAERGRPAFERNEFQVVEALLNDLFGMGRLESVMREPDLEELAINGPRDIWTLGRSGWKRLDLAFQDPDSLLLYLNRLIAHTNQQVSPMTPIVGATLRNGYRIHIVGAPLVTPFPCACVRPHRTSPFHMADMVTGGGMPTLTLEPPVLTDYFSLDRGRGVLPALGATFLETAVIAGLNIVLVGTTGAGKTSLLNCLGGMIPRHRRIVTIEQRTRELNFRGGLESGEVGNCVYLYTREETAEGVAEVDVRDLVRSALRMRCDALTVGEALGGEVYELLKALSNGHANGLTSIHAGSVPELASRVRNMLQEADFAMAMSEPSAASLIASAFHLGLTIRRRPDGSRYVHEIVEFTGGVEGTVPTYAALFEWSPERHALLCTGTRLSPRNEARLAEVGLSYDHILRLARSKGLVR